RFFGIVFFEPKFDCNLGTMMRTASCMGIVDFVAIIGEQRYNHRIKSDTVYAARHIPTWYFKTADDFRESVPSHCDIIGLDLDKEDDRKVVKSHKHEHHKREIIVIGNESYGIPSEMRKHCRKIVEIPAPQGISINVAQAFSMVVWN